MPDKTGKFSNRGLRIKPMDIANFSDDTGGVDFANARDGGQCIRDDLKLLLNGFVQHLDLLLQCPHRSDRNGHSLIYSVVHRLRQPVRSSGRSLHCFSSSIWISKSTSSCFGNKSSQFIQISVSQVVHCFKSFHERDGSGAGILNILSLRDTGAFEEQIVGKPLFFSGQVLNNVKSGSGKRSERLVAIVVHIDLLGNSAETEMVGNHKGIHPIVLWQVRIGFLELSNLLWVQNMDFPLKSA